MYATAHYADHDAEVDRCPVRLSSRAVRTIAVVSSQLTEQTGLHSLLLFQYADVELAVESVGVTACLLLSYQLLHTVGEHGHPGLHFVLTLGLVHIGASW